MFKILGVYHPKFVKFLGVCYATPSWKLKCEKLASGYISRKNPFKMISNFFLLQKWPLQTKSEYPSWYGVDSWWIRFHWLIILQESLVQFPVEESIKTRANFPSPGVMKSRTTYPNCIKKEKNWILMSSLLVGSKNLDKYTENCKYYT